MIIRKAVANDYQAIQKLNLIGLGYDFDLNKTKERLIYILSKDYYTTFVAEFEDVVVGYISASDYDCTYFEPLKNILAIVVDESFRGKGIGKALLFALENWSKETGSAGIRLSSGFNRENAHKFYLACGYINKKNQKNFVKFF